MSEMVQRRISAQQLVDSKIPGEMMRLMVNEMRRVLGDVPHYTVVEPVYGRDEIVITLVEI